MSSLIKSFTPDLGGQERRRWLALVVVCLAQLMITLDTTIVNVALPQIQRDLGFSQSELTWVVNAFLITFGSFLLLAGRMGDLAGRKRVFLLGVSVFTVASLLCGVADSPALLIGARFLQGLGAALQASVILAMIVTEFPTPADRAKAMSAYVFTAVAGGSLGLLLGGVLTQSLNWHWIFFVNLPIGAVALIAGRLLIADDKGSGARGQLDWPGTILVTSAVATAIYAIVQVTGHGWGSAAVLIPAGIAAVLLVAFVAVETRIAHPIVPLRIFRNRGLVASSVVSAFVMTGMYGTFFLGTLYLEHIRHFGALDTGLAFMPWTLTVLVLSRGITTRLVSTFGAFRVLLSGLVTVIAGLTLLHAAGQGTAFFPLLFIAFMLIGAGIGNSMTTMLTIAMADIPAADAGLASGISNLARYVSGALGLALLDTIATSHTKAVAAHGHITPSALFAGYHLGFLFAIASLACGVLVTLWLLRPREPSQPETVVQIEEEELSLAA